MTTDPPRLGSITSPLSSQCSGVRSLWRGPGLTLLTRQPDGRRRPRVFLPCHRDRLICVGRAIRVSAPPGEFHERRHACRWVHSSLVIAMLCSAALSRRFPVHDRRCRSSFDDHTGSAVPMIRAMVVHGAEPAHLGSVAENLGRRSPQCHQRRRVTDTLSDFYGDRRGRGRSKSSPAGRFPTCHQGVDRLPARGTPCGTPTPSDRGPAGPDRTVPEDWFGDPSW